MGETYRYSRPYNHISQYIDGLPNYFYYTYAPNEKYALIDAGINPIKNIKDIYGNSRKPAIIVASSPHKVGSSENPWQDYFDPDNGHIRYYGDNKTPSKTPIQNTGNKALYEAFKIHSLQGKANKATREAFAVPVLFFVRVPHGGRQKGNPKFQGFGIVENIELVTQYNSDDKFYFTNYVYDFAVFDLSSENETLPWAWISDRRNKNISANDANLNAPNSWKQWIANGTSAIDSCRRRVSKLNITKKLYQQPKKGSTEEKILLEVMKHYAKKKHKFEALAMFIVEQMLLNSGISFRKGWITNKGGDGGIDFVGRIDLGAGFSAINIILLGQAKCESINTPTSGRDLARTVARLRRGWIGAYVTTSYITEKAQIEVVEDQYPLILINGMVIAEELNKTMYLTGEPLQNILDKQDREYNKLLKNRKPEEILLD